MGNNKIRYLDHVFGEEDDIKKGNCYLVGTLLGDSLSINTLEFDVESDDSTLTQFKRNDPVIYEHNGKQIGIFYVQNIERIGATTYSFSAVSALGILAEGKHYGGIYTGQTVAEILPGICGTVPYEIKSNLKEIKLYGWLPIASPRDNLAQVLFAIGAVIKTDLGGVLRIESLWDGISGELTQNQMYEGPSVKYNSTVTQVVVTEHQYAEGGEETKLFEGTAQQGDIITFSSPMYELVADGFSILESGANYAKVSGGSGTLKGRAYIHNTREVVRDVSEAAEPNIKTVKDATLVSLVNSTAVAERLANYFQWTETIQAPIVYQGEVPGNRVATWHPYDKTGVTACLESADINLSNTLKADETLLVGFVPPKASAEYYDTMELIDEDTTWTVPDGVTSLRVVLIGGGSGGSGGAPGEDGGRGIFGTKGRGKGGSGGVKGEAGAGGKIYQNNITVSPGNAFQVHIGNGGTGGNGGEAPTNGSDGGDTTFGELSSLNGSRSENGFYEQTSGITYAKPGEAGIPGGNGDGANSTAENVIYKGVTYTPGDTVRGETYEGYVASGGGGGGASAGENGKDGTIGRVSTQPYATGGDGGDGGTPVNGENATIYGFGGSGGHGGGGGGGGGNCTGAEDRYTWEGAGGSGGMGSNGGNGYKGCVILYYSAPKLTASGPVMDRTGRFILDKLDRRFVV
ncbi:hypothetical protein ACEVJK_14180 [Flintibacter sp. P01028]|uniref:hypothetical protein n=1 Tax=Flintibacter sp. P01028 TaxID=3342382 RepID=UPI0035B57CFF